MISVSEATRIIRLRSAQRGTESVSLTDSVGRVLANDIVADTDLPPFDRSQMDGFAVIAADVESAPAELTIVGESAAGHGWHHKMSGGQTVRIMTGAPVPPGADSVQKIELTSEASMVGDSGADSVTILQSVKLGANIVLKGSEIRSGERVFQSGERISPVMIASLAAFGYSDPEVFQRPKVAILATGSEIVDIRSSPGIDQIRNSNAPMLSALAEKCGAESRILPLVDDDLDRLVDTIGKALEECDVLIISGGVSVGKYDLTKPALSRLGATLHFEKVRLKPGKPAVFATLGAKLIFGLPGNPVSAAVTFELFVRLALWALQGARDTEMRRGTALLGTPVKAAKGRDTYLPASLSTDDKGRLIATPTRWQGSSDFIGYSRAEALIVVEADARLESGDPSTVLFLI